MSELVKLGLKEAAEKVKAREVSSVELTQACLDRVQARNGDINAFVTVCSDKALEMAEASDQRVKEGKSRLIEGVPLGIKDLFCTEGVLTTASSHILDGFVPAYESTVTANLWKAGGVLLGKLNHDQFGMGTANENTHYGPVRNPWAMDYTPGGSSGGSVAAVADYQCMATTSTDTGGSSRQPAFMTGTVGIKPTYGRCSRWGVISYASSLDSPSVNARTVEDAALMLRAMAGFDPKDSTSADIEMDAFDEDLADLDVKGLKIGLPTEYIEVEGLDPRIKQTVLSTAKRFEEAGAEIIDVKFPLIEYAVPCYYIIAPAEAASNLARYDGMRYGLRVEGENLVDTYKKTRSAGFKLETKRRIMIGNYVLSSGYYDAYYLKAQKVRALIARDFQNALDKVDVILAPTAPTPPFKVGALTDPVQLYLQDIFTIPNSLAGLPAVAVPSGTVEEGGTTLPVGIQFIGKLFKEKDLLKVAYAHEQMTQFKPLELKG
ncbi:MAG: Asp-tRNA(Asn)/Glu-tRNA(Gln) amidotransferase subunit GatA [Alphaproteobacteria bacterium]|nr:Asp-tRNA(Asn)/Glu-tRNA(Gln) amidotransferase subunit GatA [Alphaproteobacteria bacterium]